MSKDRERNAAVERATGMFARPSPHFSQRVLVVDDNHDAADMLGELLTVIGYEVRVVYHGRDALSVLHQFAAQVVLLDIGRPDQFKSMNGT